MAGLAIVFYVEVFSGELVAFHTNKILKERYNFENIFQSGDSLWDWALLSLLPLPLSLPFSAWQHRKLVSSFSSSEDGQEKPRSPRDEYVVAHGAFSALFPLRRMHPRSERATLGYTVRAGILAWGAHIAPW